MFQDPITSSKKLIEKDWFCLIIVSLVVICFIAPIIFAGIPEGDNDFAQHLQFARTYYEAISSGDYLPVWASADNYGFGSVGVRFYPPVSAFALALIKILTGNWFDAIWISFLFWMFAGCVGIYFLAREWLVPKYATIAAALYVFVPYHLLQIYQLWLYAEYVAAAVLPFCFLFMTRVCRRGRLIDILFFSVSYSLLLLSHIPSTIIGSLSLGIYALFLINWNQYEKTLIKLFIALAVSLSAAAFHLIKIVTEVNWVKASDSQFSSGDYDPQQNLFPLFISVGKKYIQRVAWHFDVTIFLTVLLFLPAIFYLGLQVRENKFKDKKVLLALSVTGLVSLFMISLPSSLVWSSLPLLQKIQFPWRWLSVLSIVSVLIYASAISQLSLESKYVKKILIYLFLSVFLIILLFDITQNIIPSAPLPRATFEATLPKLFDEPGCECWWTTWAKSEAFERREKVFADLRDVQIGLWNNKTREFTIEKGQPFNVRIGTFYYPYWQSTVNNNPVKPILADDGAMLIPIPAEKSTVKIWFQEPSYVIFAKYISILTWLFFGLTGLFCLFSRKRYSILSVPNKFWNYPQSKV